MVEEQEWEFLLNTYSWHKHDTTYTLLQHGENDSYVINTSSGRFVLRRYRPGRYSLDQVQAELEWMDILHRFLPIPKVIRNGSGNFCSQFDSVDGQHLYAVFEWIDGQVIEAPTSNDFYHLGRLLNMLHTSTDAVMRQASVAWRGRERPMYDLRHLVEGPLDSLLTFDALCAEDRQRCMKVAEALISRFHALGPSHHFVHADLHFGNILTTPDKWYCLDFDECGFGHRAIDIGVVRLHLKGKENSEELWTHFQAGYERELDREVVTIGAGLRIFYMAGKIPKRQDLEVLRNLPDERIRRYLSWIESEIFG